jgi:hypothetical protein
VAKRGADPALLSLQLPLFIFKHCFYWLSSIGFVCGHWLRLRKIGKLIFPVHPTRTRRTAASRHPALRWRAPARRPTTCEDGIKACGAAWAVPDRIARRARLAFGRRRTAAAAAVPPARFASGFADHAGSDGVLCSLFVLPRLKAARKQNGAPEASFSRNGMRQRGRRLSRAMLAPTSRRIR